MMNPVLRETIGELLHTPKNGHSFSYMGYSGIDPDLSRNEAIMHTDAIKPQIPQYIDAFLLCDSDMEPKALEAYLLIDAFEKGEFDILGAVYRKNSKKHRYCVQISPGPSEAALVDGIRPVHTMGFGFAVVSRSVFERMDKPWFESSHERFIDSYRRIPGDENFCKKARGLGFQTYCHFDLEIKHDITPRDEIQRRMSC
jgi:hypothetical protein